MKDQQDYTIWIEAEEWEPHTWRPHDTDTDVIVTWENGERWVASFVTYEQIHTLVAKYKRTGDCLSGAYFWTSDMLLVDRASRQRIEEIIHDLLRTGHFEGALRYLPPEEDADFFLSTKKYTDIWIEAEAWEPHTWSPHTTHTDVIVTLENGDRWRGRVLTYEHIRTLVENYKHTGEYLSGAYLSIRDLLLVDEASRQRIEEVVQDLLKRGYFEVVFRHLLPGEKDESSLE